MANVTFFDQENFANIIFEITNPNSIEGKTEAINEFLDRIINQIRDCDGIPGPLTHQLDRYREIFPRDSAVVPILEVLHDYINVNTLQKNTALINDEADGMDQFVGYMKDAMWDSINILIAKNSDLDMISDAILLVHFLNRLVGVVPDISSTQPDQFSQWLTYMQTRNTAKLLLGSLQNPVDVEIQDLLRKHMPTHCIDNAGRFQISSYACVPFNDSVGDAAFQANMLNSILKECADLIEKPLSWDTFIRVVYQSIYAILNAPYSSDIISATVNEEYRNGSLCRMMWLFVMCERLSALWNYSYYHVESAGDKNEQ